MIESLAVAIICSISSGAIAGLISVVSLKKDIEWLKNLIGSYENRITFLERNI